MYAVSQYTGGGGDKVEGEGGGGCWLPLPTGTQSQPGPGEAASFSAPPVPLPSRSDAWSPPRMTDLFLFCVGVTELNVTHLSALLFSMLPSVFPPLLDNLSGERQRLLLSPTWIASGI